MESRSLPTVGSTVHFYGTTRRTYPGGGSGEHSALCEGVVRGHDYRPTWKAENKSVIPRWTLTVSDVTVFNSQRGVSTSATHYVDADTICRLHASC